MNQLIAPKPAPLKCFVIMPFTDTKHKIGKSTVPIVRDQWTHIFEEWIKKAVESYPHRRITCTRSAAAPGNFIKGIVQDLSDNDLVIADLTGNRPNVYYELGIRNALRNGTVMITQDKKALPSDLQTYYCFEYFYTAQAHEYEKAFSVFERDMHEKIAAIIAKGFSADNPVTDFLEFERYSRDKQFEHCKEQMVTLLNFILATVDDTYTYISRALDNADYEWGESDELVKSLCNYPAASAIWSRLVADFNFTLFPIGLFTLMQSAVYDIVRTLETLPSKIDRAIDYDVGRNDKFAHQRIRILINDLDREALFGVIELIGELKGPHSPG